MILEVVGYETNNMVINEVSKEMKIPTIELQHGTMGFSHIAYNYLSNVKYGYMPDYLFTFSEFWKKNCRFPIGRNKIISVGYPFFEKQFNDNPKIEKENSKLSIIVLSQPIYQNEIHDFVLNLVEKLNSYKIEFSLVYKLHPAEYSQPLEKWDDLLKLGCILINNSGTSLYSLFANSDIQIGVNSTSLFEGLAYKLKTFIINLDDAKDRMADVINSKNAILCNSPSDVIANLDYQFKNIEDNDYFFKKNATENILSTIDMIIKGEI